MSLTFVKPTWWRLLWSIVAAAFLVYIVAIVAIYVLGLVTNDVAQSKSSNPYVGFLMWDIVFAAPIYVLFLWWATVPIMLVLGLFIACARRTPAADTTPEQPAAEQRSESG